MSPFSHRFPIQWPLQPPPPIPVAEMVAALSLASKRLRNVEESAKHPIETPNESGSKMNNMRNHNNCWRMDQFWGQYMGSVFFSRFFLWPLGQPHPPHHPKRTTSSSLPRTRLMAGPDIWDGRYECMRWSSLFQGIRPLCFQQSHWWASHPSAKYELVSWDDETHKK